jgi:hypothetical protein
MDFAYNREESSAPPAWFALCQLFGTYAQLLLVIIGIAAIVDRIMPGRTLSAELAIVVPAFLWTFLTQRLGVISKPRRPETGARTILFVYYFISFSSLLFLLDLWERKPELNSASSIERLVVSGLFFAGFMSLTEKGAWLDESSASTNQTPPRTV